MHPSRSPWISEVCDQNVTKIPTTKKRENRGPSITLGGHRESCGSISNTGKYSSWDCSEKTVHADEQTHLLKSESYPTE